MSVAYPSLHERQHLEPNFSKPKTLEELARCIPMNRVQLIATIGIALAAFMLYNLLSSPSTDQFVTQFQEVAHYRNPNNTGPVKRIYLVTVSQVDHAEMRAYGKLQPHSKYGTTEVYFFPQGTNLPPTISPVDFPLSSLLAQQCLAHYRKLAQGQERYAEGPIAD